MKAAALQETAHTMFGTVNAWFLIAVACLGISFICWQAALRQRPVSFLHPFCSLVYVFVPILSVLLFQENVSVKYVLGIFCIVLGVYITSTNVLPADGDSEKFED